MICAQGDAIIAFGSEEPTACNRWGVRETVGVVVGVLSCVGTAVGVGEQVGKGTTVAITVGVMDGVLLPVAVTVLAVPGALKKRSVPSVSAAPLATILVVTAVPKMVRCCPAGVKLSAMVMLKVLGVPTGPRSMTNTSTSSRLVKVSV